jgi:hypothetical protein
LIRNSENPCRAQGGCAGSLQREVGHALVVGPLPGVSGQDGPARVGPFMLYAGHSLWRGKAESISGECITLFGVRFKWQNYDES